jgi:hypothetical protein
MGFCEFIPRTITGWSIFMWLLLHGCKFKRLLSQFVVVCIDSLVSWLYRTFGGRGAVHPDHGPDSACPR